MGAIVGVLGGMGPLATVDFMRKVVEETPATRDQEHVPLVVYSVPQIPDRSAAVLHNGASPLPRLLAGVRVLERAGAGCLAMPCNTAHHWYDALRRHTHLEVLHIADAVCERLPAPGPSDPPLGVMATAATLHAGIYQQRLTARGVRCISNSPEEVERLVMAGILNVKQGRLGEGAGLLTEAARRLMDRGARKVVLACTEIPLALEAVGAAVLPDCVDATRALAAACVRWYRDQCSPERTVA